MGADSINDTADEENMFINGNMEGKNGWTTASNEFAYVSNPDGEGQVLYIKNDKDQSSRSSDIGAEQTIHLEAGATYQFTTKVYTSLTDAAGKSTIGFTREPLGTEVPSILLQLTL